MLDSSHTILFCTKVDIDELHLDNLLNRDDLSGRFKDENAKEGQKNTRTGYVHYYRNEKAIFSAGQKTRPLLHWDRSY